MQSLIPATSFSNILATKNINTDCLGVNMCFNYSTFYATRTSDDTTTVLYCSTPSLCLGWTIGLSLLSLVLDGKLELNWKRKEGEIGCIEQYFLHILSLPSLWEDSTTERCSKHQTFGRRRRSQLSKSSCEHEQCTYKTAHHKPTKPTCNGAATQRTR